MASTQSPHFDRGKSLIPGWKRATHWFFNMTNIHGLAHLRSTDKLLSKMFWGALFIVGFVMTSYGIKTAVSDYLDHNTETEVANRFELEQEFPSVTLCNANRISCEKLYGLVDGCNGAQDCTPKCKLFHETLCAITLRKKRKDKIAFDNEMKALLTNKCNSYYQEKQTKGKQSADTNDVSGQNQGEESLNTFFYRPETLQANEFYGTYAKQHKGEISSFAHQPYSLNLTSKEANPSFFIDCRFDGSNVPKACNRFEDATTVSDGKYAYFSPEYGVCWTLDFAGQRTSGIGASNGLRLMLNVEAYDYMRNGLTAHTGVYMAIHDRQRIPIMHEEAILLSPNTDTYIAISKTKNKRLELPYKSNCTFKYPKELESIVPKNAAGQPIAYDSTTCNYLYHKYFSENDCNCTNPKFAMEEIMSGDITSNYCSATQADCDLTKTEAEAEAKIKDECRLECETTNFKRESSFMDWPTDDYAFNSITPKFTKSWSNPIEYKNYTAKLKSDEPDDKKDIKTWKSITSNFLKVNVFFRTHDVTEITENKQFPDIFNFLNTLGGATALWLGITLVGIFEAFEWMARLVYTFTRTILKKLGYMPECCKPIPDPDMLDDPEIPMMDENAKKPVNQTV